jgi:hypothetical protein
MIERRQARWVRVVHRHRFMALREFTDRTGCHWRVWDIRPEQMPAAVRAEEHLQSVIHGWLAFEPEGGGEKRRLSPIPARWETATDAELERMLDRADPVLSEAGSSARSESAARDRRSATPAEAEQTIRTFRYPGGRYWTVNEQPTETTAGEPQRPLLRFTSGARELETRAWPAEWTRMSEDELAELLYRSFPRDASMGNPTSLRRRRGDIA